MGGKSEKEYIWVYIERDIGVCVCVCVCVYLSHFAVHLKLTQHCVNQLQ